VGEVRTESAKIVAEARREAAQIKSKAQEEGKQAAMQAVEASLRNRLDQQLGAVLTAMQQAVTGIAQSRQAWQQRWESQAVQLATAMAARIVRRELRQDPQITIAWVREALELAAGSGQIVLKLNPQDQSVLGDRLERLTKEMNRLGQVRVAADPAISSGGCRVETEFGSLDQQLEAQLARLTEELLD
jgi:flagellar assembly protein FliH